MFSQVSRKFLAMRNIALYSVYILYIATVCIMPLKFVENLFSSLVVDLKTAWIINCSQNTSVTLQKAIFCYYSPNIQCSWLISNFTQIQIVSKKRLQIFGLWSQILIPLSTGKQVQWTLVIVNSVFSPILFTNERCLLFSM